MHFFQKNTEKHKLVITEQDKTHVKISVGGVIKQLPTKKLKISLRSRPLELQVMNRDLLLFLQMTQTCTHFYFTTIWKRFADTDGDEISY